MYVSDDYLHVYVEVFTVSWMCLCKYACFYEVACYLSTLLGLASGCFSQKFAKGGDCWIFECWLHFCLNQIFKCDVGHDVPTSWHGSVDLYLAWFYARVYLFKESTPLFLLVKVRAFSTESNHV